MFKSCRVFVLAVAVSLFAFACASKNNAHTDTQSSAGDNSPSANTPPSGTDAPPPPVDNTDSGSDTSVDSGTPGDASHPPTNQSQCIAACEAQYPDAAKQNALLDSACMLGVCANVCNDLNGDGKNYLPNADAGNVCDTVAANSYPISTPSADCSTCLATNQNCCQLWIAIFGSANGQALNNCSNTCFAQFKN